MAQDHIDMQFEKMAGDTDKIADAFQKMANMVNFLAHPAELHSDLASLLNRYGIDTILGIPDHVLAKLLIKTLDIHGEAVATAKRLAKGGPFDQSDELAELQHQVHSDDDYPSNKTNPQ